MDFNAVKELAPTINAGFVASLLSDVFGVNSPIYIPYSLREKFTPESFTLPSTYNGHEYDRKAVAIKDEECDRLSQFGTPVIGSFWIAGSKSIDGIYQTYDSKNKLVSLECDDFEFPVATLVSFRRPKNIIKTPTIGGKGTVKEIFGFDDWAISIKGICLDDPSRTNCKKAEEQMEAIIKLNKVAGSLEIAKGKLFLSKEITNIVFEDLSIDSIQGRPGVISFEITACSDEDILQ